MRLWAFGTSPQGLGLPSEEFWSLTLREIDARLQVFSERAIERFDRWAVERCDFRNAHFETKGVPWEPDHLTGKKKRPQDRKMTPQEQLEVRRANQALQKVSIEDVPDWAK